MLLPSRARVFFFFSFFLCLDSSRFSFVVFALVVSASWSFHFSPHFVLFLLVVNGYDARQDGCNREKDGDLFCLVVNNDLNSMVSHCLLLHWSCHHRPCLRATQSNCQNNLRQSHSMHHGPMDDETKKHYLGIS